jgi:flagellar motor switch protein FliN
MGASMKDQLKWLQREWAARLGSAVESMTGEAARAEAIDGVSGPVEPGTIVFRQTTDLGPDACLWVLTAPATWNAIGSKVLDSAGLEGTSAEEARGTFLEVLQQSLAPLAQSLGAKVNREVAFLAGTAEPSPEAGLEWAQVRITLSGVEYPPLELAISPGIGEALTTAAGQASGERSPREMEAASKPAGQSALRGSKTMDLLLEVELPVGVSFGRVRMKLRDAVKLTTGSIVELNRRVTEPVEVIVNNCVIARGEVVVVEGNYGVRIQQIVSREERLRTLF